MRHKYKRKTTILGLITIILLLGLGYAFLTANLNINGASSINNPTWNIYWDNVQVMDGSVTGDAVINEPTIDSNKTTVSFRVKLSKPGDYYEFTVDAKNDGTIDAMIESINRKLNNQPITSLPDYLTYTVTYDDDSEIALNQALLHNTKKTYKVKVAYKDDLNPEDLPDTNQSLNFKFDVTYKQGDENIITEESSTVIFNSNGGVGTIDNQIIPANTPTALSENTFTREGYIFKGWNTKSDGTGTTYRDKEIVTNIGNVVLFAQWKQDLFPTVFEQTGECIFNGAGANITGDNCSNYNDKKYIDTGIALYSSENINKDYEIGFTIEEYVASNNVDQATLMNSKLESTGYPGVVFRKNGNTDFEFASRKTSSANAFYRFATAGVRDVRIYRINNEIYYKIDDGERTLLNNLSQYNPTFNLNVWFGAAPANADGTSAQRYLVGKLSNMYIKLGTYVDTNTFVITLNPNGGEVSPTSINVSEDDSVGELPIPTKPLHHFDGWYTGLTDGVLVDSSYVPTNDMEIFARWTKNPTYTISFDVDGGSSVEDIEIEQGSNIGTLPTTAKSGKSFDGWYLEDTFDTKVTSSYIPTSNITLHAKWIDSTFPKVFEQEGACTFGGESGTITGEDCSDYIGQKYIDTGISLYSSENINKDYEIGFTIVSYDPSDNPSRATLMNTKLEATGYPGVVFRRDESTNNFILQSRKTSSANEQKTFDYSTVTSVKIYRISNEIYYSINGEDKVLLNNLSEYNPTFNLTTWFGAAPSNEAGTAAQRYFKGTLSKMYVKLGEYEEVGKVKVTFNANGGIVNPTSKFVTPGESIGSMPTPTKDDSIFLGWYTGLMDGIAIDNSYIVSNEVEVYAHWLSYSGETTLLPGSDFNIKLKETINPSLTNVTIATYGGEINDTIRYNIIPTQEILDNATIVSTEESAIPFYVWYENGIVYYYTTAKTIYLNENSSNMFRQFWSTLSIQNFVYDVDTSKVTDMSLMFALINNPSEKYNINLDLSNWNVSNVTNMSYMFWHFGTNATNLKLDFSNWDTSKVTDMSYMFNQAAYPKAESIVLKGISDWNVSRVIDMSYMFYNLNGIAKTLSLDLSNWNVSSVTNMRSMFWGYASYTTNFYLDISNWDTSNVENMNVLFNGSGQYSQSYYLNISNWNTSHASNFDSLFSNAGKDATSFSILIPPTNGNGINNTVSRMYGLDTSNYSVPNNSNSDINFFTIVDN